MTSSADGWEPGATSRRPAACILVGGEVVGWVDFDPEPHWLEPGEVNLGYAVFPRHRGRGYATRAVGLLLRHLTVGTDCRTAVLVIDHGNERSLAVARRLGLKLAREDGVEVRFDVDVDGSRP